MQWLHLWELPHSIPHFSTCMHLHIILCILGKRKLSFECTNSFCTNQLQLSKWNKLAWSVQAGSKVCGPMINKGCQEVIHVPTYYLYIVLLLLSLRTYRRTNKSIFWLLEKANGSRTPQKCYRARAAKKYAYVLLLFHALFEMTRQIFSGLYSAIPNSSCVI